MQKFKGSYVGVEYLDGTSSIQTNNRRVLDLKEEKKSTEHRSGMKRGPSGHDRATRRQGSLGGKRIGKKIERNWGAGRKRPVLWGGYRHSKKESSEGGGGTKGGGGRDVGVGFNTNKRGQQKKQRVGTD